MYTTEELGEAQDVSTRQALYANTYDKFYFA